MQHGSRAGLSQEAHLRETLLLRDGQGELQNDRVKMEVLMAVPVGRTEAHRTEGLELPADLSAQGFAQPRIKSIAAPGAKCRRIEAPVEISERGGLGRDAVAEHQVQAHAELRISGGDF